MKVMKKEHIITKRGELIPYIYIYMNYWNMWSSSFKHGLIGHIHILPKLAAFTGARYSLCLIVTPCRATFTHYSLPQDFALAPCQCIDFKCCAHFKISPNWKMYNCLKQYHRSSPYTNNNCNIDLMCCWYSNDYKNWISTTIIQPKFVILCHVLPSDINYNYYLVISSLTIYDIFILL